MQSKGAASTHRYLISRLRLQVFYLWRHVLLTVPPFILWWSNLEILFVPLHRSCYFIGGLRCQAIQTEHSLYVAERTWKAVYNMRCLCFHHTTSANRAVFTARISNHRFGASNIRAVVIERKAVEAAPECCQRRKSSFQRPPLKYNFDYRSGVDSNNTL
jgi:hypothetical protein